MPAFGLLLAVPAAAWQACPADLADSQSGGIVRYVTATGANAANACANGLAPCRSVQHAVDMSFSGDPIHVSTGVHTGVTGRAPWGARTWGHMNGLAVPACHSS